MRTSLPAAVAARLAAGLALVLAASAFAEERRELHAHRHGHAELEIAVDGDRLTIALEAPGESVVGFEHVAETEAQKAAVATALERLSDPAALFVLPEGAGCSVASAEAELHRDGDHNAFEAEYAFTCTNAAELTSVETALFTLYPGLEEIDARYAVPGGQGAAELEADAPVLTLPTAS